MVLNVFLRNSLCTSRLLNQQIVRLSTQPGLVNTISKCPTRNLAIKEVKPSSLLNSTRCFRTSAVRQSNDKPHDHSKMWVVEKLTSAVLVPLIPLALYMPNKYLDSAVAILITAHSFWGLEAIAVDYARPSVVGPVLAKAAIGLVYLLSIAALGGLFYIISHDIGIANSVRQLWEVKSNKQAA